MFISNKSNDLFRLTRNQKKKIYIFLKKLFLFILFFDKNNLEHILKVFQNLNLFLKLNT